MGRCCYDISSYGKLWYEYIGVAVFIVINNKVVSRSDLWRKASRHVAAKPIGKKKDDEDELHTVQYFGEMALLSVGTRVEPEARAAILSLILGLLCWTRGRRTRMQMHATAYGDGCISICARRNEVLFSS